MDGVAAGAAWAKVLAVDREAAKGTTKDRGSGDGALDYTALDTPTLINNYTPQERD